MNAVFGALADDTRRQIVRRLARGASNVTTVAAGFDISLPAISRHVRVLEEAGLVTRERRGRVHQLHLNGEALARAEGWIQMHRAFWESSLDRRAAHLDKKPKTRR